MAGCIRVCIGVLQAPPADAAMHLCVMIAQMVDVVPRALGVATANHEDPSKQFTTVIVPACSPIPEGGLIVTSSFGTSRDNQTGADIEICEGEEKFFDDNTQLGEFEVSHRNPRTSELRHLSCGKTQGERRHIGFVVVGYDEPLCCACSAACACAACAACSACFACQPCRLPASRQSMLARLLTFVFLWHARTHG